MLWLAFFIALAVALFRIAPSVSVIVAALRRPLSERGGVIPAAGLRILIDLARTAFGFGVFVAVALVARGC